MKYRVLIIDDDKDILEPLSLLLEGDGYTVSSTPKGDQTYSLVNKFKPDVILLDILMSGSDGRKICINLKQHDETKHIPIIMMSAHPGGDKDSINCGADEFIAKPFESEELLALIKKTITT